MNTEVLNNVSDRLNRLSESATIAMATPPNETWANPSPMRARLRINKNEPSIPATIVTITDARRAL